METPPNLSFYRQQSPFTNPGRYAPLLDALPNDPALLANAVHHVLIHPYHLNLYGVRHSDIDNAKFGVRSMEAMLERILKLEDAPLTHPRAPKQRLGAICRNFAVMFVAFLRHHGIPSRERIGFGGYFQGKINYEHRIAEYWDAAQGRWILADPQIDAAQRNANRKINFNTMNITPKDPFYHSGDVWLKARKGLIDAAQFGDSDTEVGLPLIRYALLHDFDALNGYEVLGSDAWDSLIEKPDSEITPDEWTFLDTVAAYTLDPDSHFEALRTLHATSAYGEQVRAEAKKLGFG